MFLIGFYLIGGMPIHPTLGLRVVNRSLMVEWLCTRLCRIFLEKTLKLFDYEGFFSGTKNKRKLKNILAIIYLDVEQNYL